MLKVVPPLGFVPPVITPSAPRVINVFQEFQYNVEGFASNYMKFPYMIGEGPLYWFRVDWYPQLCPDPTFVDIPPNTTYKDGYLSCPTEVTDICLSEPPTCSCDPPCVPGQCISRRVEVWHMLATSVTHLCYRINNECCNRKPSGFIRRVQQYMRPALCCDVAKFNENSIPITDEWVDVTFIDVCECGNLVDPCIATIIYPWHINNCGIHGPAYTGPVLPNPPPGSGEISPPPAFAAASAIEPKQITTKKITNKFGPFISEVLHCSHNLNNNPLLNNLKQTDLDLHYDREHQVWRGTQHFREWKMLFEWSLREDLGYKFNLNINKSNLKTKIMLNVKGDGFTSQETNFVLNVKKATISKGFLQSKVIQDDLGLFRNWDNLKINLKG